jgi:hypothetical protein
MTETGAMQDPTQEMTTGYTSGADLYERLRDSAPKEARVEWRDADRWASHLGRVIGSSPSMVLSASKAGSIRRSATSSPWRPRYSAATRKPRDFCRRKRSVRRFPPCRCRITTP